MHLTKKTQFFTALIAMLVLALSACSTHNNTVKTSSAQKQAVVSQAPAQQDGVEITQVNRQFVLSNQLVQSIDVKVGEKINFRNADDTAHNVYSASDLQSFDLGSFMPGEVRSVSFEKKGKALVECAIHPQMQLDVTVN